MKPAPTNLRATGERIEQLIDELRANADGRSYQMAEDLLRLVTELYGVGLARVMELVGDEAPGLSRRLAADDLVASLLLVHGLHPDSLEDRLEVALAHVRPLLAGHGGGVELLEVDHGAGAVHLRLVGSCDGCPSSAVTLQLAVEQAIIEAAPEIVTIDVEPPTPVPVGVPVHLSPRKPTFDACPSEVAVR